MEPSWVEEAARLPVAFAQVREDPLLDAWVVRQLPAGAHLVMIASGGCTLAYLAATCDVGRIDVVDANPAQLALARLKLHLLNACAAPDRAALLGHAPMPAAEREARLSAAFAAVDTPADAVGPPAVWASDGPDHAGRYERVFARLRQLLSAVEGEIADLLSLTDPAEQARRADPTTPLGRALDAAFDDAMSLPVLVRLFGEGATANRAEPFARHFARRTRHALATLPAADNPYLWQVLAGRYPAGHPAPWLACPAPPRLPEVTWHQQRMTDALGRAAGRYDFVHLSNILDWLSPAEAKATLDLACAALRPGGRVFIRQLNSTLDIPSQGPGFAWQGAAARALHARDRSYFYRGLHLGVRR